LAAKRKQKVQSAKTEAPKEETCVEAKAEVATSTAIDSPQQSSALQNDIGLVIEEPIPAAEPSAFASSLFNLAPRAHAPERLYPLPYAHLSQPSFSFSSPSPDDIVR